MPTTSNFGWTTPADTDLVKDGAAAIRTLGNGIDTSFLDLKGGTTGQVLSKASNTDLDFSWVAADDADAIQKSLIDAEGDLIVGDAADAVQRLAIGSNGSVLTVDTSVDGKIKWAAPAGSTFAGCSLKKTVSTQTINNATWTAITWDGENYDTDGYHSTSTNTSRITIPAGKAGKYLIAAGAMITANNTGARLMKFEKNGAGVYYGNWMPATPTHTSVIVGSQVLDLAVNDYVEVFIYQDSGGSLDINGNNTDSTLTATYLGA